MADGVEVGKLMNCWTKQKGFPVLTAKLEFSKEDGRLIKVHLHQKHFRCDSGQLWNIPLVISLASNPRQEVMRCVMPNTSADYTVYVGETMLDYPPGSTVMLKPRCIGYYRVLYSDGEWLDDLVKQIKTGTWHVDDLLGFFEDLFPLVGFSFIHHR